jgi:hypothetical protein
MAFTVTKMWNNSPYDDGLGVNTPLGAGFVRKVSVAFTAGTTTGDITAADLGCQQILDVLAIIPKDAATTNAVYVGTVTSAVIPLTSAGNNSVEVVALVRGL